MVNKDSTWIGHRQNTCLNTILQIHHSKWGSWVGCAIFHVVSKDPRVSTILVNVQLWFAGQICFVVVFLSCEPKPLFGKKLDATSRFKCNEPLNYWISQKAAHCKKGTSESHFEKNMTAKKAAESHILNRLNHLGKNKIFYIPYTNMFYSEWPEVNRVSTVSIEIEKVDKQLQALSLGPTRSHLPPTTNDNMFCQLPKFVRSISRQECISSRLSSSNHHKKKGRVRNRMFYCGCSSSSQSLNLFLSGASEMMRLLKLAHLGHFVRVVHDPNFS